MTEFLIRNQVAAAAKSLQSCPTLRPYRQQPTRLLYPWDSPGKNTGVGCHFLLQCMTVQSYYPKEKKTVLNCKPCTTMEDFSSVRNRIFLES